MAAHLADARAYLDEGCGDYYCGACGCQANALEALPESRLGFFEPAELLVIGAALGELIGKTLEAARLDAIPAEMRVDAAHTLLHAARLSFEIDDHTGAEHPPLEEFAATAQAIADGSFAEQFRAALAERKASERYPVEELDVEWSCGNPFYYGYGFDIAVEPVAGGGLAPGVSPDFPGSTGFVQQTWDPRTAAADPGGEIVPLPTNSTNNESEGTA